MAGLITHPTSVSQTSKSLQKSVIVDLIKVNSLKLFHIQCQCFEYILKGALKSKSFLKRLSYVIHFFYPMKAAQDWLCLPQPSTRCRWLCTHVYVTAHTYLTHLCPCSHNDTWRTWQWNKMHPSRQLTHSCLHCLSSFKYLVSLFVYFELTF